MNLIIALISKVFAIIIAILYFNRFSKPYKLVFIQIVVAVIVESLGFYIGNIRHHHNIWLFNIYELLDFWLMTIVAKYFLNGKMYAQAIYILLFIATALWIFNCWYSGIDVVLTWYTVYDRVALLLIYLLVLFNSAIFKFDKLIDQPLFWLCFGSIIFYGVGLPTFALLNYMNANNEKLAESLFNIIKSINFLRYLFVGYSFYLIGKQSKYENIMVKRSLS